ncbi:MAG: phenylalanine--tRNA ligase subunit alpha [Patescibacteria group bacterium]|nr:phenylalanine--tRNA ligase subunit alpha [Patescibacteria group bacterium]
MNLDQLKQQFISQLSKVETEKDLALLEIEFLGRKGKLTEVLKSLAGLSLVEKKRMGQAANESKEFMEREIKSQKSKIKIKEYEKIAVEEKIDINAPVETNGRSSLRKGHLHPLSNFIFKIERIFEEMGYEVVDGPEIETDYYNFTAVRIPEDSPSRDDHDTFYIKTIKQESKKTKKQEEELLLRTQTTAMQVRYMEKHQPPIKIIVPGKTYRRDDDASHSPMFHQFEALVVDKGITLGKLKKTLSVAMKKLLGEDTNIRFRSSYFPFVEPALEVDVTCAICKGKGCNICKNTGWVELLGAGMVHPEVLKTSGIDPEIYSGFAFAMGIDRLCMMHHKIPNIKMLFENDIRFLEQF